MTIDELISDLEDARENMGGGTEIRVAYQPNWPLRATISNTTIPDDPDDMNDDPDAEEDPRDDDRDFFWIALGEGQPYGERPYAPEWAWR